MKQVSSNDKAVTLEGQPHLTVSIKASAVIVLFPYSSLHTIPISAETSDCPAHSLKYPENKSHTVLPRGPLLVFSSSNVLCSAHCYHHSIQGRNR